MKTFIQQLCLLSALACFSLTSMAVAPSYLEDGKRLWAESKFAEAEVQFKKAIAAEPEDKEAHANLAALYLAQNKTTEAIPAFQEAIMYDPENAKLFASLSLAYLHQEAYSMARAMASQALKLDPKLAQAEKLMEYIDAKKEVLDKAAEADANMPPANHPHTDIGKMTTHRPQAASLAAAELSKGKATDTEVKDTEAPEK